MDDDAFERALEREAMLREKLAAGEIGDDELDVMRDVDDAVGRDVHLTLDQARRLVDEGVDPAVVAAIVEHFPAVPIDDAISLAADYGLEIDAIGALVRGGAPRELDSIALKEVFDYEITGEILRLVVDAGFAPRDAVATAVELAHHCEVEYTLRSLRRAGIRGLTVGQIATIADYDVNPQVLRRLLDGDPDLDVEGALQLVIGDDYDPDEEDRSRGDNDFGLGVSIAAVRFGAGIARDVAKLVSAGLRGRTRP